MPKVKRIDMINSLNNLYDTYVNKYNQINQFYQKQIDLINNNYKEMDKRYKDEIEQYKKLKWYKKLFKTNPEFVYYRDYSKFDWPLVIDSSKYETLRKKKLILINQDYEKLSNALRLIKDSVESLVEITYELNDCFQRLYQKDYLYDSFV